MTHTAPAPLFAPVLPIRIDPVSAAATADPNPSLPDWTDGLSRWDCCHGPPPLETNVQTAPSPLLSLGAAITASVAPGTSATWFPKLPSPTSPLAVSFCPTCVQVPFPRLKIHAAPTPFALLGPPMTAMVPSADSDTELPK